MAAVNFPNPAATNPDTNAPYRNGWYNSDNGVTYIYVDAENAWKAANVNNANFDDLYVNEVGGDHMQGPLTIGPDDDVNNATIELNADGTAKFAGDVQMASQNGGPLAGFRNQIINGDFRIWQRGTSVTYVSGLNFGPDRWKFSGAATISQDGVTKPLGAVSSMRLSANALPQYGVELTHNDEGSTSAPFYIGSQWTLSVWCNEDITGASSMFRFRDTVGSTTNSVEATDGVPNWKRLTTTASNGFHRYGITVTITTSPVGTNNALNISLPASTGSDRRYAMVQLEPGPVATPFEHRPIGTELALCQRYYVSLGVVEQIASYRPPSRGCAITFPTAMRGQPAISVKDYNWQNLNSGTFEAYTGPGRSYVASSVGFTLTQDWNSAPIMLMCRDVVADAEL